MTDRLQFDDSDAVKISNKKVKNSNNLSLMQRKSAAKKNKQHKSLEKKGKKNVTVEDVSDEESAAKYESNRMSDDSEEEGEEVWEKESREYNAKLRAQMPETPKPQSSSFMVWFYRLLIFGTIFGAIAGLSYLRFNDGLEMSDRESLESKPPEVDYYTVMGLERSASQTEVNKAYRKMALQLHPDKNPNCEDCAQKFDQLSTAYKTLSDPQKRRLYDAVEVSYETLKSKTVDLTEENFDKLVLKSGGVWFVQLYTDWHKACIRFAPVWEELSEKWKGKAHFGRLHLATEKRLVHKLPVSVRMVPTVLVVVDGHVQKSKSFFGDTRDNFLAFKQFIDAEYPDELYHVSGDLPTIETFLNQHTNGYTNVLLFPSSAASGRPSLSLRALARQFSHSFRVGQILSSVKNSKKLLADVKSKFGAPPQHKLPVAIAKSPDSKPHWLEGSVTSERLRSLLGAMQRKMVIVGADSAFWNNHCVESNCVALLFCEQRNERIEQQFVDLAHNLIENEKNTPQFVLVNAAKEVDMWPLCEFVQNQLSNSSLNYAVAATVDGGQSMSVLEIKATFQRDLRSFVHSIISDTTSLKLVEPAYVPVQKLNPNSFRLRVPGIPQFYYDIQLSYLYMTIVLFTMFLFRGWISEHWPTMLFLLFASTFILPLLQWGELLKAKLVS